MRRHGFLRRWWHRRKVKMAGGFVARLTNQNGITADTTVPVEFGTDSTPPSPSAAIRAMRFYVRVLAYSSGTWGVTVRHAYGSLSMDLATKTGIAANGVYALTPVAPFDGAAAVPTSKLEIFFDASGINPQASFEVYAVGAEQ